MINRIKSAIFLFRKRIDMMLWDYLQRRDRINFPVWHDQQMRKHYWSGVVQEKAKARRIPLRPKGVLKSTVASLLAISLVGCASLGSENRVNPLTGTPAGVGTYAYSVKPDGEVVVNADSLRGGPSLEVDKSSEGNIRVLVKPTDRRVLEGLLPLLLQ